MGFQNKTKYFVVLRKGNSLVRRVLITGAGSTGGIGFATAKRFAHMGFQLFITSTTERIFERRNELRDLGVSVEAGVFDLTEEEQVRELVRRAKKSLRGIDIVVNNAGMGSVSCPEEFALAKDTSLMQWNLSLARNLTTAFLVSREAIQHLSESRCGRIVMVASTTGFLQASTGEVGYAAAKAAMIGVVKTLALELAPHGITVNAVAPGWIASEAQTSLEARHGRATPFGRSGTPDEVASVITFLSSDDASYVTGQTIVIDGGNSLIEGKAPA